MGTPEYAAVSLRRLLQGSHSVVAAVTRPDKPRGRGKQVQPGAVRLVAEAAGIEVLAPISPRDPAFLDRLRGLAPDLGVVVAYGRILPREALELPRLGCINAHASLLPAFRGAAPIERAILAGVSETGVTIMRMNEGLDEGDVLVEKRMTIGETMTGVELREHLAQMSADLLAEVVDLLAEGVLRARPQDHALATFAPPLRKEEAGLHWGEDAAVLQRQVRAFAPSPGAFAFDGSTRLKILEAHALGETTGAAAGTIVRHSGRGLVVACGSGALEVTVVQPEGKRPMSALDYERGARGLDPHRRLRDGL